MSGKSGAYVRRPVTGALTRPQATREARRGFAGNGVPLGGAQQSYFQARFGWDFGSVRVHAGPDAASAADRLGARAFTAGRDIAFGSGEYAPGTEDGQRLLAHELAHVVQQSRGGPAPDPSGEPSLEADANRSAAAAMARRTAAVARASGVGVAREPKNDGKDKPYEGPPFHFEPVQQDPTKPGPAWRYVPDRPVLPPLFQLQPPPLPPILKSPGDPQAGTPTGGVIPGNAQVQDVGDFGLTYGLSDPLLGSGRLALGFGIAAGVADLGHDVGLELGSTGGVPGGNSTSALFVPHIGWAPKNTHLNLGAFGNLGATGGTSPPGRTDVDPLASVTGIIEVPIGDRDRPVVLPSLQGTVGYNRFAPVGAGFASDALTSGAALNVQWNPSYYTAADSRPSKTTKNTFFIEGAYSHTKGGLYGNAPASSVIANTESANIGYQHNFRLSNGHLIVSPLIYIGGRHEADRVGETSRSQWGAMLGGGIGISFSPWDKKADD
jgi:hypothetical protein